jgi:hypothetical protein
MIKLLLPLCLLTASVAAQELATSPLLPASTSAASAAVASAGVGSELPSEAQRAAQGKVLAERRKQLEDDYSKAIRQCYQKFDVTSCRLEARERRIEANAALRKEELKHNAMERRIQAQEAQRRTAEKNDEAAQKEAEAKRAQAMLDAKKRADQQAQKQIDHALQGNKRAEYEQKQHEAAQHKADVEKKLRERTKEPAAPLPVPNR